MSLTVGFDATAAVRQAAGIGRYTRHLLGALAERGEQVRALARSDRNTEFLRHLGVELVHADLLQPDSLHAAVAGADVVYHCAARVGNWGTWLSQMRNAGG